MKLQHTVCNALEHAEGAGAIRRVLVAVSGGADSVSLLLALHALAGTRGVELRVAHLNHGLRGAESDADARFVRALAQRLDLPCTVGRAAVALRARRTGVSVEMAARTARYAFLVKTARRWQRERAGDGPVVIATAHTADDQAETILMRLARGAGMRGLSGIPAEGRHEGVRVIRPLLHARRRDVLAYLADQKQTWREDASNRDPAMVRNRVRHDVLPYLARTLNPRIDESLIRAADVMREEDAWMRQMAEERLPGVLAPRARAGKSPSGLLVAALASQPTALRRRLIRGWLEGAGLDPDGVDFGVVDAVDRLARGVRGTGRCGATGRHEVVRRYNVLRLVKQPLRAKGQRAQLRPLEVVLRVPGKTPVPAWGLTVEVCKGLQILRGRGARVGALPAAASLSAARVGRKPLMLRTWRPGDRIRPLGLNGRVKLQDLFVNAKIPAEERDRIPVLVCGREIIWIPGYRVAQGWELRTPVEAILEVRVSRARSQP